MQNFATVPLYRDAIRDRGEIWSAAGGSRTSYVDVRDVGAVAAKALLEDGHRGEAYTLTGPSSLSLDDVVDALSRELAVTIRYVRPSLIEFVRHAREQGTAWPLALVMTGIGLVSRAGLARSVDPTLSRLLSHEPGGFDRFVRDYRTSWTGVDRAK